DSARARCEIQASLPRWIANAWTQPSDLGLSCHKISTTDVCLACLYWPNQTVKNETQLVAEAIGFERYAYSGCNLLKNGFSDRKIVSQHRRHFDFTTDKADRRNHSSADCIRYRRTFRSCYSVRKQATPGILFRSGLR